MLKDQNFGHDFSVKSILLKTKFAIENLRKIEILDES